MGLPCRSSGWNTTLLMQGHGFEPWSETRSHVQHGVAGAGREFHSLGNVQHLYTQSVLSTSLAAPIPSLPPFLELLFTLEGKEGRTVLILSLVLLH